MGDYNDAMMCNNDVAIQALTKAQNRASILQLKLTTFISAIVEKILNPYYLDGEASAFSSLQNILKTSPTSATTWVGEAGGAYNSGHNLVTNAFVFSFWYLDQLGMASKYDTKTYCRQSLVGGNYGLLNTTTFKPNPE